MPWAPAPSSSATTARTPPSTRSTKPRRCSPTTARSSSWWWEAGKAFDLAALPVRALEEPPTILDLRAGFALDQAMYEAARRTAQHGAALGRAAGLDAESRVVADDVTVADTLIRLAREFDSPAIVMGAHGHRSLGELLLGSTSRDLVNPAPCPVVVVRDHGS